MFRSRLTAPMSLLLRTIDQCLITACLADATDASHWWMPVEHCVCGEAFHPVCDHRIRNKPTKLIPFIQYYDVVWVFQIRKYPVWANVWRYSHIKTGRFPLSSQLPTLNRKRGNGQPCRKSFLVVASGGRSPSGRVQLRLFAWCNWRSKINFSGALFVEGSTTVLHGRTPFLDRIGQRS